jgi:hypothetical protein
MGLNPDTSEAVAMTHFVCFKCGVPYTCPTILWESKRERHKPICCPNGHDNLFQTPADIQDEARLAADLADAKKDLTAARQEIVAMKETIVTLRGIAEQAEAHKQDAERDLDVDDAATTTGANNPLHYRDGCLLVYRSGKYLKCPLCENAYKYISGVRNHVFREHSSHPLHREVENSLAGDGKYLEVSATTRADVPGVVQV